MKISSIDKLKSVATYKDLSIISVDSNKSNKNLFKNDCILILSDSEEDYIDTINKNLYKYSSYKYIYSYNVLRNSINSTINRIQLNSYYRDINNKLKQKRLFKKSISEYKGNNVLVDTTNMLNIFYKFSKTKQSNTKLTKFIDNLVDNMIGNISKVYYDNLVIHIPIHNNQSANNINKYLNVMNINNNSIQYIYHIIKNKNLLDYLVERLNSLSINNLVFIFNYNTFTFKVSLSDLKIGKVNNKILSKIKKFITVSINGNINELEENNEDTDDKETDKNQYIDKVVNSFVNVVKNDKDLSEVINSLKSNEDIDNNSESLTKKELTLIDGITKKVSGLVNNNVSIDKENPERLIHKLSNDPEFIDYIKKLKDIQTLGNENVDIDKKVEILSKTQDEVKLDITDDKGKLLTLGDVLKSNEDIQLIKSKPVNNHTLFDNTKSTKTQEFDKSYMEKNYEKDILNTFSAFNNDKELPLYIQNIEKTNTSDSLNLKETYKITYKDTKNVRHTVTIDIPIIIDNKYIYVNGSKKLIQKQLVAKPIIKIAPDTVQISSDYNKYFVTRFGSKLSEETEVLKKFITDSNVEKYIVKGKNLKYKLGNYGKQLLGERLNIYYTSLGDTLISIENDHYIVDFDYFRLMRMVKDDSVAYDSKLEKLYSFDTNEYHMVGYSKDKKELIIIRKDDSDVFLYNNDSLIKVANNLNDFIIDRIIKDSITDEGKAYLNSFHRPKSLVYNRLRISGKEIPLIIVLGYEYGLINVLDEYKVDYIFTGTNKRSNIMNTDNTMKIPFKNGILYYDNSKVRNSLLLSGLNVINTRDYEISNFELKGEPYIEYFESTFGSRNIAKGISNNLSLFLDPKTLTILKKLSLPENMLDILLYANTLLESNTYHNSNHMSNFRLRGTEQVNAILYKVLADAYRTYKDTSKNGNPIKVSVPQNILLKKLVEAQTVDEASDLNPTLEIERQTSVTFKGVGGVNSD